MQFLAREEVAAPIDTVFAAISDFEWMERAALRRGADVARADSLAAPGPGMAWIAEFDLHGKRRRLETAITTYAPPDRIVLQSHLEGLAGVGTVDLVHLAPSRTRIAVAVHLRPQTLGARVVLQTVRLARTGLSDRFNSGLHRFAREIEAGRFGDAGA
ncbi:Polyketide cyclase / dehydrase and lipid transport [Rhodovulum sp. ES.010]|uniref:SRPBCC family protein n=1 Tax=Rhodovulum sp. ES.010 TaxID=1882821 RepID=UPI00092C695B|nr:SRPBCC family protein [Rhodovulum sp. ES.010]SIO43478.1 Polyketide cyclase / dehydrase and lipid transport [Rhodovulum sp. ES.010]